MHSQNTIRFGCFVTGLLVLLIWEWLAPHHQPTADRRSRWMVNFSLTAFNSLVSAGLCAVCLFASTSTWMPFHGTWFDALSERPWLRVALEVMSLDLVVYWQHRLFHVIPSLWRFHGVHHTDLDLDVSSASRFHVGEILISAFIKLAATLLLGISVTGLMTFEIVLLLAAQFQHANIRLWGSIERMLWLVIVPPSMHRIHHCPERRHQDSNFGTLLPLWDRMFGTLCHPLSHDPVFGILSPQPMKILGLRSLLMWPFSKDRRTTR